MTDDIEIRDTTEGDLDFVLSVERHPENAPTVSSSPREVHLSWIADPDARHVTLWHAVHGRIGFLVLRGLRSPNDSVELQRIVVHEKGKGYGAQAMCWAKTFVFDELGAHRLWLDVSPFNERGRRLYRSQGFVEEGTLRECQKWGGKYESLILMSILDREHRDA